MILYERVKLVHVLKIIAKLDLCMCIGDWENISEHIIAKRIYFKKIPILIWCTTLVPASVCRFYQLNFDTVPVNMVKCSG